MEQTPKFTERFAHFFSVAFFRKLFQSDESRFLLATAVKVWSISALVEVVVGYILFSNVRLNYYFFRAHGYRGIDELGEAYYQHVMSDVIEALPWVLFFHVVIFFMGLYVGHMMLRPFKSIGSYCASAIEDPNTVYQVESFSAYRLLVRFSEIFFEHIRSARKLGVLEKRDVPPQFTGVHKPVLDTQFLFHFCFFLLIIMIVSIVAIMGLAVNVHENTTQIALKMLKADNRVLSGFFHDQRFLIDELWILTAALVVGLHLLMGLHLYEQVSGAAFGIFATMRSFLKGNWRNRVHLVGYSYLRESTRSLNKYLDWIEKNLTRDKQEVESSERDR